MLRRRSVGFWQTCTLLVILIGVSSAAAWAANPKAPTTFLDNKAFFAGALHQQLPGRWTIARSWRTARLAKILAEDRAAGGVSSKST
jgi:hypothetical protein